MQISKEREKYHELLNDISKRVYSGQIIYDIGKSNHHEYKNMFPDCDYKTIDVDATKKPDILLNVEKINERNVKRYMPRCDLLLCNGVIEQCFDPMQLIRSCHALVKRQHVSLFGFVLLGYPEHKFDRFRFTEQGAYHALKSCGYTIRMTNTIKRADKPSYFYAECVKD